MRPPRLLPKTVAKEISHSRVYGWRQRPVVAVIMSAHEKVGLLRRRATKSISHKVDPAKRHKEKTLIFKRQDDGAHLAAQFTPAILVDSAKGSSHQKRFDSFKEFGCSMSEVLLLSPTHVTRVNYVRSAETWR